MGLIKKEGRLESVRCLQGRKMENPQPDMKLIPGRGGWS